MFRKRGRGYVGRWMWGLGSWIGCVLKLWGEVEINEVGRGELWHSRLGPFDITTPKTQTTQQLWQTILHREVIMIERQTRALDHPEDTSLIGPDNVRDPRIDTIENTENPQKPRKPPKSFLMTLGSCPNATSTRSSLCLRYIWISKKGRLWRI